MTTIVDPICDMIVDVDEARDHGLTLERPEREYAFCALGCLLKFAKSPNAYIPKVEAWLAAGASEQGGNGHDHGHGAMHASALPEIDAGMRE